MDYNYYSFNNFNNRESLLYLYIPRLVYIQVLFFVNKRNQIRANYSLKYCVDQFYAFCLQNNIIQVSRHINECLNNFVKSY